MGPCDPYGHSSTILTLSIIQNVCSVARIWKFIHHWHRNTILVHRSCLTLWSCVQMNSCICVSQQGVTNNSLHRTIWFSIKCLWYHLTIARCWHDLTGMTIRHNIIFSSYLIVYGGECRADCMYIDYAFRQVSPMYDKSIAGQGTRYSKDTRNNRDNRQSWYYALERIYHIGSKTHVGTSIFVITVNSGIYSTI